MSGGAQPEGLVEVREVEPGQVLLVTAQREDGHEKRPRGGGTPHDDRREQVAARAEGRLLGIGISSFTEVVGAGHGKEYDIAGLRMYDSAGQIAALPYLEPSCDITTTCPAAAR